MPLEGKVRIARGAPKRSIRGCRKAEAQNRSSNSNSKADGELVPPTALVLVAVPGKHKN